MICEERDANSGLMYDARAYALIGARTDEFTCQRLGFESFPETAVSEYQYYEFVAVEGPISDKGLQYAQTCSSRAQVSRFRWQNVYHFGSFHGKAETLLKYYDAHFYMANWGTVRLGLAFPAGSPPLEAIQPYLRGGERYEDTLSVQEIENRFIVWWERNEEGGWGGMGG